MHLVGFFYKNCLASYYIYILGAFAEQLRQTGVTIIMSFLLLFPVFALVAKVPQVFPAVDVFVLFLSHSVDKIWPQMHTQT